MKKEEKGIQTLRIVLFVIGCASMCAEIVGLIIGNKQVWGIALFVLGGSFLMLAMSIGKELEELKIKEDVQEESTERRLRSEKQNQSH